MMLSMLTPAQLGRVLPDLYRRSGISLGGGRELTSPIVSDSGFIWTGGVLGATVMGGASLGCSEGPSETLLGAIVLAAGDNVSN